MKENVFDVLMYLFENYFYHDDEPQPDRDSLESELFEAGFTSAEIRKAFEWLDGLAASRLQPMVNIDSERSIRVYADVEMAKLDADCRGLLLFLEQVGILSAASREVIVERVMALADDEVDIDTLKWIVLMVLFNQPGEEEAYACMETLLFDNPVQFLH
jgi:Smg protein